MKPFFLFYSIYFFVLCNLHCKNLHYFYDDFYSVCVSCRPKPFPTALSVKIGTDINLKITWNHLALDPIFRSGFIKLSGGIFKVLICSCLEWGITNRAEFQPLLASFQCIQWANNPGEIFFLRILMLRQKPIDLHWHLATVGMKEVPLVIPHCGQE